MKKGKFMITILFVAMMCVVLIPNKVKGVTLQANGGTPATYTVNNWLLYVREMQKTGGALGLGDTINENLTSTNINLDIHMEKNTEYGAMAILSASSYGMGSTPIKSGETTTGNATGIKININKEWVAAACEEIKGSWPRFGNAVGRYKDVYPPIYKEKIGDAIATVGTWHGAKECAWIDYVPYRGLVRSRSGSLFSYCGHSQYTDANWDLSWSTRAVVVVGSGI